MEEGISWPGTKGRLVQVNGKLGQLGGQLRAALQSAKGTIDLDSVLDPIIKKYKEKIRLSAEGDEIKAQAYKDLDVLRKTAAEHSPSGQATAAEANNVKQAIGDAVNWEKRPAATPMHDLTINAYREAYGQLKDSVNGMIGKDGAELNRRVSNLMAARNSLKELANQQKAGRATGIDVTKPTASIKDAVGHVAPAAIRGAQNLAGAAVPTVTEATRVGALAEGNASQQDWIKIKLSNGEMREVHPEDLQELQRRDPQAKVISQ